MSPIGPKIRRITVAVAQLVERQVVVLDVAGSSPVGHPFWEMMKDEGRRMKIGSESVFSSFIPHPSSFSSLAYQTHHPLSGRRSRESRQRIQILRSRR